MLPGPLGRLTAFAGLRASRRDNAEVEGIGLGESRALSFAEESKKLGIGFKACGVRLLDALPGG